MELQGKIAVVTGAGMGMGKELALRLVRDGCNLALADVNVEGLAAVKEACLAARPDAVVSTHRVDMGVRSQIVRFGDEVRAAHGGTVHLLFNNAGIQIPKSWDRMTEAEYDRVMAINLDGVVTATRVFWPFLLTADQAAIVNTSSVAAFFPAAGGNCNPYAVSKFAVRGFSEHLETDCRVMAPHITVSCVHPGAINTEIIRKNANLEAVDMRFLKPVLTTSDYNNLMAIQEPERSAAALEIVGGAFEKWGHSAKEAADMIVDGVVARKSRIMVGWDAVFLDLWVRAFPRIFVSPLGRLVSMGSSTVARHLVKPAIVCAVGAYAGYRWHGGSKL